jgi:hypothetical protein
MSACLRSSFRASPFYENHNYTKFGIFRCYQYLLGCAEALRSGGVKSAAAYAGNVLKR